MTKSNGNFPVWLFSRESVIMTKKGREEDMLNKVILIGNLVAKPALKFLPSGTPLCEFTIAWNRRYKYRGEWRDEVHFFDVKAFGRFAEDLAQRLTKGYQVAVEGRLIQDRWAGQDGKTHSRVRIIAESVKIIRKPRIDEVEEEVISLNDVGPEVEEKAVTSDDYFDDFDDEIF